MNIYKNPLRFYGFQKLLGLLLAPLIVSVVAWIASGSPPATWSVWPPHVRQHIGQLASGLYTLAGLWWFWFFIKPIVRAKHMRRWVMGVVGFFASGIPSAWDVVAGLLTLLFAGNGYSLGAAAIVGRVALLPLGCGLAVALWPDVKQRLQANSLLRRWFVSGAGPHSGWAGPIAIAKHTRPLSKQPATGHFASGLFIGRTNFEDTYSGGEEVFLEGPSHVCTIAQTGGGKHICAAPNYAMYRGSMVHCTVKPEAADQFLGARVDPALLPPHTSGPSAGSYGVDPRGITQATCHVPNSRVYLLDVTCQSVYPSNRHTLISEIDPKKINARVLALAIADGSFPERKSTSDPWFREAPRNFLAAGILHALTTSDDLRRQCLPRIIERAMGVDRLRGESGPQVMKTLLKEMVSNRHPNVGAFIQTTAAQVLELGEKAYGTLKSEFQTNCSWALDPYMEKQLTGVSDFSYTDLGDDDHPVTVFLVPPRGDAALRAALPWLRSQTELALQILQTNPRRPSIPTLFVCDEARQYLEGLSAVKNGLTLLRDARVKLWLMFQSWPSVIETIGRSAAVELESCSTMQYFAINDLETARRISDRLGETTLKQKNPLTGHVEQQVVQVITPDEVLRELSLTSPLSYVMGGGVTPMRLRRVAYKRIVTREGARFQGLSLTGQYDEGLSRYSYGGEKL